MSQSFMKKEKQQQQQEQSSIKEKRMDVLSVEHFDIQSIQIVQRKTKKEVNVLL